MADNNIKVTRSNAELPFDFEAVLTLEGDPLGPLLFSLVLHPLICKIRDSFSFCLHAWYLDDDTIVGDTLVVGKVLELIMKNGPRCGLHFNVDKTEVFWPKEDPRSRLEGVFPPNISRPMHGVKLLGGPASVDFDFSSELVMKRVAKTIELMDAVARINDHQCELLLLRALRVFLNSTLLCVHAFPVYLSRLNVLLMWLFVLLRSVLSLLLDQGDVLNYAFLASRSQSAALQTKLLRHTGVVASGPTLDDVLCVFNTSKETDILSNPDYERVFAEDIYGDHAVSCAGIIGIKHRHNIVCDTLVDICYRSRISASKEVDIGLEGGCEKPLRPTDMLLYSWVGGLDMCMDLTKSSPLTQTGMADFAPGRAMIDATQRKRVKYEAKCTTIRYGFLPFSFSSLGELERMQLPY
ncbi:hypothetical protein Tco_0791171 [Tanacetum coccineum]